VCQHHIKGDLRTLRAHTITKIVNTTALGGLRAGALEQDHFLLMKDDRLKDAFFKDMPELVAFTSPAMGGKLHKFTESTHHRVLIRHNKPPTRSRAVSTSRQGSIGAGGGAT
jgi:hypothetical protein